MDTSRLRLRLTALYAGVLAGATALLLALSWWLLRGHFGRTLPDAYADAVLGRLAGQYALAFAGTLLLSVALGWLAAGRALRGTQAAMDAQRRFAANASHELRSPLTIIRTETEVALDDPEASGEDLRASAGVVLEATDRMDALLDGLLVLAHSSRALQRRESVDLAAAACRAVRESAPEAERAQVRLRVDTDAASVRGDRRLLERLVANLVENAVRHNEPGGWAEVRVEARDGVTRVRTENSGGPISPEALGRLAEPFQRLDRNAGGSGLGLSIVRAVAEAHGGSLRLAPRPAGGLVAEVTLTGT
jgi:hypothetical protein